MKLLNLFGLAAVPIAVLAQPNPGNVTGNTMVHDPSLCKDDSGTYFLFSTAVGLEIRTSTDRIAWTLIGTVWARDQDTWTDMFTLTSNGNVWAPDCQYVDGQFNLYYAASSFGSQNSGIFFARSKTGLPGSWSNEGLVVSTSSANDYNAIDPNLYIGKMDRYTLTLIQLTHGVNGADSSGAWHLTAGSFWTGLKQFSVSSTTGQLTSPTETALWERTENGGAIEAGYLFKTGGFFYLFSSWDLCCRGTSSTYNIRVTRSTSLSGPFVDQSGVEALAGGGTLILGTHGSIVGPGGQSIFLDSDGPILVYHYYTATGNFLGINRLDFSSGWPVVV